MKRNIRPLICLLLCLVLVFGTVGTTLAVSCNGYSDWFKADYEEMLQLGLIPDSYNNFNLSKDITRGEMCTLAVHAFVKITGNANEPLEGTDRNYFSDTDDPTILWAHELGIVGGYPDGTYRPDQKLTRQEFFQIIRNFCNAAAFHPTTDGTSLNQFVDANAVADWAIDATTVCVKCKYVGGSSGKNGLSLNPTDYTSRQEAMAMFLRCYKGLREYYHGLVLSATVVDTSDANVTVSDANETLYVTASLLNVRDSWSTNGTIVGTVSYGQAVTVTGNCSNGWKRIQIDGHIAYVSGSYLTGQKPNSDASSSTGSTPPVVTGTGTASEIANFAMSFVGYNYVYGAESPSEGFDCSGLMYYVLTQYGYSMNRVADDQMNQGAWVDRGSLQVGDLVFFGYGDYANHVGMYIGNGNFVHASTPSTGVRINSLNETYYNTRYIGAKRIIG